jgi:hypothetical protein
MAQIVEAINEIYNVDKVHNKKLFLAGGVTNCPDWQAELIDLIKDYKNLVVYNPRRANFPINVPKAAEEQITWEFEHLRDADIIIFWFSKGSLNPIVLYELGRWGNCGNKPIIIGVDPEYERITDVLYQTNLSRQNVVFVNTIKDMSDEIYKYLYY